MKFKPLGERVVVEPIEEKSTGGIVLPETVKKLHVRGKVIAIGDEVKKVKVGDIVLYEKGSVMKIETAYNEYSYAIFEKNLIGIIE